MPVISVALLILAPEPFYFPQRICPGGLLLAAQSAFEKLHSSSLLQTLSEPLLLEHTSHSHAVLLKFRTLGACHLSYDRC
jgi:hypothetical protein